MGDWDRGGLYQHSFKALHKHLTHTLQRFPPHLSSRHAPHTCLHTSSNRPHTTPHAPTLSQAVAAALEAAGFRTTCLVNPDTGALQDGLSNFERRVAEEGSVLALVFFSGHGVCAALQTLEPSPAPGGSAEEAEGKAQAGEAAAGAAAATNGDRGGAGPPPGVNGGLPQSPGLSGGLPQSPGVSGGPLLHYVLATDFVPPPSPDPQVDGHPHQELIRLSQTGASPRPSGAGGPSPRPSRGGAVSESGVSDAGGEGDKPSGHGVAAAATAAFYAPDYPAYLSKHVRFRARSIFQEFRYDSLL